MNKQNRNRLIDAESRLMVARRVEVGKMGEKDEEVKKDRLVVTESGYKEQHMAVSYTHLTLPTIHVLCRSRWSPYH